MFSDGAAGIAKTPRHLQRDEPRGDAAADWDAAQGVGRIPLVRHRAAAGELRVLSEHRSLAPVGVAAHGTHLSPRPTETAV